MSSTSCAALTVAHSDRLPCQRVPVPLCPCLLGRPGLLPGPSFVPSALPVDSFALAAGLTSAVSSSSVIALAVTSELVAGAISMGLGGYLSGRVEADTHEAERLREVSEVEEKPWEEEDEVVDVLGRYGLTRAQCEPVLAHFRQNKDLWGTLAGGSGNEP